MNQGKHSLLSIQEVFRIPSRTRSDFVSVGAEDGRLRPGETQVVRVALWHPRMVLLIGYFLPSKLGPLSSDQGIN